MAKKRLTLVTGGTGFIGQKLVERLIEMGEPVRLLVRKSSNIAPCQAHELHRFASAFREAKIGISDCAFQRNVRPWVRAFWLAVSVLPGYDVPRLFKQAERGKRHPPHDGSSLAPLGRSKGLTE